jgi:adenylyltransferase/sulfurtransferase
MQALAAIKLLSGFAEPQAGQLLVFDGRVMDWRKLTVPRDPACPVCARPG